VKISMGPPAIEIDDVGVHRDGGWVMRDFSLAVEPGRKVALTGPSGCGKSTLLGCILGFVRADAGRVVVDGSEVNAHSVWTLRRRIGYVAQEPDPGRGTVDEVLARGFHYRANRSLAGNLERVPAWMERLGLALTLRKKAVADLSGGEKQRIALMAALLLERDILLLDEITSALDRERRASVLQILRECPATMLIVSHDEAVFAMSDHVVEMRPPEPSS